MSQNGKTSSAPWPLPTAADERYPIRILTDGTWTYHGSPIGRMPLVKLFSTVLSRDTQGDHWLITPAERGRIVVDDAAFVAVEVTRSGEGRDQVLRFRTNIDEEVEAGPDHPIEVRTDAGTGFPRPYILLHRGLEARIGRAVFYELVDWGEVDDTGGADRIGIWSKGTFFDLGPLDPA